MTKAPTSQYIPKSDTTVNNLKSSAKNLKALPKPLQTKLLIYWNKISYTSKNATSVNQEA